ncbi:hypothetical protein [Variovorax boronicumulans]|uniref:hypothetical protein n=1 Tax=Variovorax boronicumulans TaxID=436515 RepID=UPI001C573043
MRERPILFSAPMVGALLAGTKTQTRRVVKHAEHIEQFERNADGSFYYDYLDELDPAYVRSREVPCPYGQPGDRLWVRENGWQRPADRAEQGWPYAYDADAPFGIGAANEAYREEGWKRRPSIHMPRWASRILLEVTDVRVERLQDISETDAIAEGIERSPSMGKPGAFQWCDYRIPHDAAEWFNSPIHSYETLWDQINGAGAWAANPWVWAVSFRRVPPTGGISQTPPGGSTA